MNKVEYERAALALEVVEEQLAVEIPADAVVKMVGLAVRTIEALEKTPMAWDVAPLRDIKDIETGLIAVEQGALRLRRKHLGGTWLDKRVNEGGVS